MVTLLSFWKLKKCSCFCRITHDWPFIVRNYCKTWTLVKELSYTVNKCNLLLGLAGPAVGRPLVSQKGL